MKTQDKPIISARVHPGVLKRLDKLCQKRKLSRQAVIEMALDFYLR